MGARTHIPHVPPTIPFLSLFFLTSGNTDMLPPCCLILLLMLILCLFNARLDKFWMHHVVIYDFVADLMGTQLPSPPIFGPYLLWPNGWMYQDGSWYGGRTWPRRLCIRWGPSSPSPKGGGALLPNFRPMSIVAKRLDGSRWQLA